MSEEISRNYKGFLIDDSEYPIMKIIADGTDMTLEDVRLCHIDFRRIIDKHEGAFVGVVDATVGKWVGGDVRIALGKGQRAIEDDYVDRYKKQIIVVPNPIIKMMLLGVNLASKPIVPQKVFSKFEEAYQFAKAEIANF